VSTIQALDASNSGLTKKSLDVGGYTAHYYEGGAENSEVLVLLHGLTDDKNSFVKSVSELTETHRVILPDLQAHGENAQVKGRDYSIKGQANFIRDLLEKLGVKSLDLVGNSMGGHTAAAFTYRNPGMVKKLILIGATGMPLDHGSTYFYFPEKVDTHYMKEMYANSLANPPDFPEPIWNYLAAELNAKSQFFNTLVAEVENGEDFRLDDKMKSVKLPTLILWGKEDKVVPMSYAKGFHSRIQNSELKLIDGGHAPQIEVPEIVQNEIYRFIKAN